MGYGHWGTMRGKYDRERGATLIEAAIILPTLLLIVLSIVELGLAFKDFLTTDFAAKEGARVGALAGNDVDADCDIIQSIVAGYTGTDFDKLHEITVFRVSETGAPVPGTENDWTFANNPGQDPTDCDEWAQSNPSGWPPGNSRNVVVGSEPLHIIGITIDTEHDWVTGFPPWRGTMNIVRTAIQRLEPEAFE